MYTVNVFVCLSVSGLFRAGAERTGADANARNCPLLPGLPEDAPGIGRDHRIIDDRMENSVKKDEYSTIFVSAEDAPGPPPHCTPT